MPRFAVSAVFTIAVLGISTPILALNEPAVVTSSYEVLEPETWVGDSGKASRPCAKGVDSGLVLCSLQEEQRSAVHFSCSLSLAA